MKRISVYIISVVLLAASTGLSAQFRHSTADPDSVDFQLNIRIGADIANPILYFINNNNMNLEGYISVDLNEKYGISFNGGYADYNLSKFSYEYSATGIYLKPGADFNILKPQISEGKYWAGIGVRYGVGIFSFETPSITYNNYWGTTTTSIPPQSATAHFVEIAPGFNAKISNNFTMGWRVNMSTLLYAGPKEKIDPIYLPGYGARDKGVNFSFNYFLSLSFPYKTIKAKFKDDDVGANYEELETETE